MHDLVGPVRPGEEQPRHARVRIDRVGEDVVDRLVAADIEAAMPRALDQQFRRRDHQEQVDELAEAREQVAAGLVGIRREAVEAEPIDQQMRHPAGARLVRHVVVELVVDERDLRRR